MQLTRLQVNEYETDPNFLQFFQSSTTNCLIIHMFCKSCEPESVFVLICTLSEQFHVHKYYKTRKSTLSCIGNLEENIDLSHIHPVLQSYFHVRKNVNKKYSMYYF